jgi:hypothetical protein
MKKSCMHPTMSRDSTGVQQRKKRRHAATGLAGDDELGDGYPKLVDMTYGLQTEVDAMQLYFCT